MTDTDADTSVAALLGAAVPAAVLVAVGYVALGWGRRLSATGAEARAPAGAGEIALGVVTGATLSAVTYLPLLLAVLLVVARPSRRRVAAGVATVYATGLLLAVGLASLNEYAVDLSVLAAPLDMVVTVLAVTVAVWLAYHGGYDRLAEAVGDVDPHPLFAPVARMEFAPGLPVQRGLVAAGLAAVVGAGGRVLARGVAEFLRTLTRAVDAGTVVRIGSAPGWGVGITPARFPVEWLFEASLLLAVLLVVGPRLRPRELAKGVAVVFGVQSTVLLLPAFVPPFRPVELLGASGPVLAPLSDALPLAGVAAAVWLAFHGGRETFRSLRGSEPTPD